MDFEAAIITSNGLIEKLANLASEPGPSTPLLSAKIKLLWDCNLSCSYCPVRPAMKPLSRAVVARTLRSLHTHGLKKAHFSGGEIFLHPEVMDILGDATGLSLQVNLTTNGTFLDRKTIKELGAMNVHSLSVSIDSANHSIHDKIRGKKGAFKTTLKAMRIIASNPKKFPKLRVNTVVTTQNADDLGELHKLISSLGPAVRWKLIPVDSDGKSMRLTDDLLNRLRIEARAWTNLEDPAPFGASEETNRNFTAGKYGLNRAICYVPWLHLFIDPTGFCYPCCMSARKMPALGHIEHNTMEEILFGKPAAEFKMTMACGHLARFCKRCDDFIEESKIIERLIKSDAARNARTVTLGV